MPRTEKEDKEMGKANKKAKVKGLVMYKPKTEHMKTLITIQYSITSQTLYEKGNSEDASR
jgi:hypothetical protein